MGKFKAMDSAAGADFTLAKGGEYDGSQFDETLLESLVRDGLLVEVNTKPSDLKETTTSKTAANRETRGGSNE